MVLEKTLESPLDCKEIQSVHSEDQFWVFIGRTDAEAETPILWPPHAKSRLNEKDLDAGKRLRAEEGGNRGWGGWIASPTQRTWVWANSWRLWKIGKPGVLQSMRSPRVRHDLVTEQPEWCETWVIASIFLWKSSSWGRLQSYRQRIINTKALLKHELRNVTIGRCLNHALTCQS